MYNDGGNPTISNCVFVMNANISSGGGMYNRQSSPIVTNCSFIENFSSHGSGIFNSDDSSPILVNCIFIGNCALDKGGAIYNHQYMHGLPYGQPSEPVITNCIFIGNWAKYYGGGIVNFDNGNGWPVLINCTFTGNSTDGAGGGLYSQANVELSNCILWGNSAGGGTIESDQVQGESIVVNYSCIQGWTGSLGGIGNHGLNPTFVDADGLDDIPGTEDDDLHLCPGSPCIDAGDNNAVPPDVNEDLDGNPRIFRAAVDMGAYEYQNTPPVANAGGPYIEYATSWFGANVELNGTNSNDPDGDAITYEWDLDLSLDSDQDGDPCNDVDATDPAPESFFSIGQTDIALVVIDEHGLRSERDTTNVTVSFIEVAIDIKPGSFPNAINMGSNGVVPVAFLTDWGFDASTVDPATVTLRGEDFADGLVKLRGKKDAPVPMANLEDVDGDGDLDLVVHLETEKLAEYELEAICQIGALTYEGYVVSGSDTIQIVPE
jgi:predicted outer membrane repeat protein